MAATLREKVVSYAFTNQNVTGEYSPDTGQTPGQFLASFKDDYGTEPEVTAVVVIRKISTTEKSAELRDAATPSTLAADKPTFSAGPVVFGPAVTNRLARDTAAKAKASSAQIASPNSAQTLNWRPDYTDESILGSPGPYPFFWESYYWYGGDLYTLPSDIGLEFEINQDNPNVFTPQNVRPACFDTDYKKRFWADNENYTWSVSDVNGGTGSLGAYADYNDLSDLCRNESITIGLRHPQNLSDPYGDSGLYVTIQPPQGYQSSSVFSGNVQAVASEYCDSWPGNTMSLTDCMGVTPISNVWGGAPSGTYNRATAALTRGWTIPNKCWTSDGKGLNAPIVYSCFG